MAKGVGVAYCSYCARSNKEAGPLVEGRALSETEFGDENSICFICEDCAETVIETYERDRASKRTTRQKLKQIPTPRQILAHLDQYIIGQTPAKRMMAVQVHAHYKRLIDADDMVASSEGKPFIKEAGLRDVEIEKSNSLLIGPTGCGKTLIAKALANFLDVPFAIGDATTLTEAGYVGEDVENLLLKLIQAADYDIEAAQRGIIYIDEIDKIGKTGGNVSITRDVSGEGVQQSLLKLIEGTVANVPPQGGRKHPEQQYLPIDTSNILFICGGAFNGLDAIIKQRLGKKRMGFGNIGTPSPESELKERNELLAQVQPEDLDKFGLIPELIGRLPVIATLEELDVDALVSILREPKNALLKQYQKDAAYSGVKLEFTDDAAIEIAKRAAKRKTGARALRAICEEFMADIRFDLPEEEHRNKSYVIDATVVRGERNLFDKTKEAA